MPRAGEHGPEQLGLRVLLIEDSIDTLNMMKLWLETFGCEVFIATAATEGIKLAKQKNPQLIISDIGMPDINGYELMRVLRKSKGLEEVPAIAISGYGNPDDKKLALAAGYNAHLTKPTNMQKLLLLIRKLTGK
jgi:CheY-like chemotaxis protein